jgi:hypothetical protein
MKYWVEFCAGSTGVFRALPVAVTFLKIEDKGQKVVHATQDGSRWAIYTWAPHCYAYNLAKQLTPRDEEYSQAFSF